jgi:hypothetical protein
MGFKDFYNKHNNDRLFGFKINAPDGGFFTKALLMVCCILVVVFLLMGTRDEVPPDKPYKLIRKNKSYPELLYNKIHSSKYNPNGYSLYTMDNDEYGNLKHNLWMTLVISEDDYREIKRYKNITYLGNSKYFRVLQDEWDKCIGKKKKEVCDIDAYKVFKTKNK